MEKYLPTRISKKSCILLLGLLIVYYLIDNLALFNFFGYKVYNIVFKPLYWGITILIVSCCPRLRPASKLRMRESIYFWAILLAILHIVTWFAAGFIDGFGKSPYSHTPIAIITNLLVAGSMLIGQELVRNFLIRNLLKKESYLFFITLSLFFSFLSFSIRKYTDFKNIEEAVRFIGQFFAPEVSKHFMATYLAFIGGPIASLGYMGAFNIIIYFSPILPNLKWITSALVGIMCPVFSLMYLQGNYINKDKQSKSSYEKKESVLGWLVTSVVSIGLIWFVMGVFPVYPSVIATGSMEPLIKPGDVILVDKSIKEVKEGDVIQFEKDSILISHRIIEIIEDREGVKYQTKGDNNSTEDADLVRPEEIKGKVISVIPKIGWPTLFIKQKDNVPLEKVEF